MGEQQNIALVKALLESTKETQEIINKQLEKMIESHNDIFRDHNTRIRNLEKWKWGIVGGTVSLVGLLKLIWK